jgi:hypothetical protein
MAVGVDLQYDGTALLAEGKNPYRAFIEGSSAFSYSRLPNYPAHLYVALLPGAHFGEYAYKAVWLMLNAAGAAAIFLWLWSQRRSSRMSGWVVYLCFSVFLCSTPARVAIGNGQVSLVALGAMAMAWWLCQRGRLLWAGFFLALALDKYTLTLPFLLLFANPKGLRVILVAAAWHAGAVVAMATLSDGDLAMALIGSLRCVAKGSIATGYSVNLQDLVGVVSGSRVVGGLLGGVIVGVAYAGLYLTRSGRAQVEDQAASVVCSNCVDKINSGMQRRGHEGTTDRNTGDQR